MFNSGSHLVMVFGIWFLLFKSGSALQCYVCNGHHNLYDCNNDVITCAPGYDSCASFTELTKFGRRYNKFCKHESVSCTALCTNYGDNYGSCVMGDMAKCCTGDLCNENDFQEFTDELRSKSSTSQATIILVFSSVFISLILWR